MKTKQALQQTISAIKMSLPTLVSVLLLTSFIIVVIPKSFYSHIFAGNYFLDSFFGAIVGSIAAGNPMTSFIISGELMARDISMIAITAFIVSWVTVGFVQMPAEIVMLGKKFALTRNLVSFISAIIIAFLTVITLSIL